MLLYPLARRDATSVNQQVYENAPVKGVDLTILIVYPTSGIVMCPELEHSLSLSLNRPHYFPFRGH